MSFIFFLAAGEENVCTRVDKVLMCVTALSLTSETQTKCTAAATLLLKKKHTPQSHTTYTIFHLV